MPKPRPPEPVVPRTIRVFARHDRSLHFLAIERKVPVTVLYWEALEEYLERRRGK